MSPATDDSNGADLTPEEEQRLAGSALGEYHRILLLQHEFDPYLSTRETVRHSAAANRTLRLAAHPASATTGSKVARTLADAEVRIRSLLETSARRRARLRLRLGLFLGFLASGALIVGIGVLASPAATLFFGVQQIDTVRSIQLRDCLLCVTGGSVGAIASVLLRTRSVTQIDYRNAGLWAGFAQVVIGWVFSIAVLILIKASIIDIFADPSAELIARPGDVPAEVLSGFFWTATGIVVGFNERWASNLLRRDEEPGQAVTTTAPGEPASDDGAEHAHK